MSFSEALANFVSSSPKAVDRILLATEAKVLECFTVELGLRPPG